MITFFFPLMNKKKFSLCHFENVCMQLLHRITLNELSLYKSVWTTPIILLWMAICFGVAFPSSSLVLFSSLARSRFNGKFFCCELCVFVVCMCVRVRVRESLFVVFVMYFFVCIFCLFVAILKHFVFSNR